MSNQVENPDSRRELNQNTVISGIENNEETIDSIRQRADLGDAEAQVEIGIKYFEGKSVETDYAEALKYFKLSADQGNSRGQFLLGGMYLKGVGVTQNYEDAFKYFKLSAEQGNSEAQFCVGALYKAGKGITKDYKEAIKYFKLSADQGHKDAKKALNELELKVASSLENSKTKENDIKENNDSIEQNTPKKQKATSVDERISQLQKEYKFNPTAARVEIFLRDNPFIIVIFAVGIIAYIYYSYNEPQNTKSAPQVVVSQSSSTDNNSPQKTVTQATSTNNNMASTELDGIKSLIRAGNYTESSNRLKILVEQGNKEAEQLLFGTACMLFVGKNHEGKTIETNLPLVAKNLKFLVERGNTDAQLTLFTVAMAWFEGKTIENKNKNIESRTVETNYTEATNCLIFLADKGNKEAKTQAINLLFVQGLGLCIGQNFPKKEIIEKNIPEGVKLIKLANSYNTPEVQKLMKDIYEGAENGDRDSKEIVTALKVDSLLSESNNNPYAIKGAFSVGISLILGKKLFENGEIIEKNISEGVIIIKLVNSYNIPEIQEIMKKIYSSAENGDPDAQEIVRALNNENLSFQIPMEETQAYKDFMKELKDNPKSVSEQRKENATSYKISVDLKPSDGLEALKISKMVQEFYSNYFINEIIRNEPANWFVTEHRVVPSTRRILRLLSYVDWSADYIIRGNDIPLIWKISNVVINNDLAEVKIKRFWSENDNESEEIVIICKKINGNWLIDDIVDLNVNSSAKKSFYSFFNRNQNLAVVKGKKLPVYSKVYGERAISFYDTNNRILALFKSDSKNSFNIDFEAGTNLSGKIDSNNMDSDWSVNTENVIPFNFFNKIRKGESKYLAYIVLGEPSEDSSNKLFYSPDDYISYDKDGKITSWNGFEDLKEFFDDNTGLNNQNIGFVNAKSSINLRKEPNTKSEKVCGLSYDTQVMILDYNGPKATFENITSNWYLITDGTKVGWAFGGFIRKEN